MAGGAFSFAEILRDEYIYLHGSSRRRKATVEEKHLRELPRLIARLKAAPPPDPLAPLTRESFLAQYCDFTKAGGDLSKEQAIVTAAFGLLIELQQVAVVHEDDFELLTLYKALLRSPDIHVSARLRNPEVLRKLLRVPNARRLVFEDTTAAEIVGTTSELRDVFLETSAALRLIQAMPNDTGRTLLRAYPALLASIADDAVLEELLSTDSAAAGNRQKLVEAFLVRERKTWYSWLWPFGKVRWIPGGGNIELASSSAHLRLLLDAEPSSSAASRICAEDMTAFNAVVLETAFSDCFLDSYDVRTLNTSLHEKDMAAICLSGGGIRSATFNLGVLQGLADHGLLTKFHYLSTVSGGGYIGSWLSSWIRRHSEGVEGVARDIKSPAVDPEDPEVRPVHHLREYSSYLAPRAVSLSLDTWTLVATYFRNLILNWTMLLPALAAVLVVPRLVYSAAYEAAGRGLALGPGLASAVMGLAALVLVAWTRPKNDRRSGPSPSATEIRSLRRMGSVWLWWLLLAGVAFCIFWASLVPSQFEPDKAVVQGPFLGLLVGSASAVVALGFILSQLYTVAAGGTLGARMLATARLLVKRQDSFKRLRQTVGEVVAAGFAGFMAGVLLRVFFATAFPPENLTRSDVTLYFEQYVVLGLPLFLLAFFFEATLLVGLTTLRTDEYDREWWARSAAAMLLAGFIFMIGAFVAVVLPIVVGQIPAIVASAGGASGIAAWLLAKSAKLRSKEERETRSAVVMRFVLQFAALLAVAAALSAIGFATSAILARWINLSTPLTPAVFGTYLTPLARIHLIVLHESSLALVAKFAGIAALVALVMSLLLDVNVYSMHAMYRNRLVRAYLGASRWGRRPDSFTGFDPQDDIAMYKLRAEALWTSSYPSFDAFARKLEPHMHIFAQLPEDVQDLVRAYIHGPERPPEDEVRSEVTRALNELMARSDIRHGVPAPPNSALFAENRRYLESQFPDSIEVAPFPEPAPDSAADAPPSGAAMVTTAGSQDAGSRLPIRSPERRRPPLHVISAALNLVAGDNLAWQERKADSFTISPLHAGNRRLGYRDAYAYARRISLGTSLAISGAAVSPNMGFNSSPIVTFLMTLFNARLGWWLGNPSRDTYEKSGPTSTLQNLIAEAVGNTHDKSNYVFLSDGGHFDNLGLYEMVRRRCRWIVVSDATADGKYAFGDLGNAVRKIRIDMGIPITLQTTYLPPTPDEKTGRYCALGMIHYGDVDTVDEDRHYGFLLYIKPAVHTDCPPDVRNYQKESEGFPHETTIDQFFCESQFESYRALGRHVIGRICGDEIGKPAEKMQGFPALISSAADYVQQARPQPQSVKLVF